MKSSLQSPHASQKHQDTHDHHVCQPPHADTVHRSPRFNQIHPVPHTNQTYQGFYANSALPDLQSLTPISLIINQPDLLQKFNDTKRKEMLVGNIFYYRLNSMELLQILYRKLSQFVLFVKSPLILETYFQDIIVALLNDNVRTDILSTILSSSAFDELSKYNLKVDHQCLTFTSPTALRNQVESISLDFSYFSPPTFSKFPPKYLSQLKYPNNENPHSFFRCFLILMDEIYKSKYFSHQKTDFYKVTNVVIKRLIQKQSKNACYLNNFIISIMRPNYVLDMNLIKLVQTSSNWITDKIQIGIFLESLFSYQKFEEIFSRKRMSINSEIEQFLETTGYNYLSVLYSLAKHQINISTKEVKSLRDWFSGTLSNVQLCINYFAELITDAEDISILNSLSYDDFSQLMLTFRFIFSNFRHPYNYIQGITKCETQNLLFNEFMYFSNIFSSLAKDLFTCLQPCSIPFLSDFVLSDIFGNRISFIPSNERNRIITPFCGNSPQESFPFNYNSSVSITHRNIDNHLVSQYSIGDFLITHSPKSKGSTFGIIIEIVKCGKSFHKRIFCKELFYFSETFKQTFQSRVHDAGVSYKAYRYEHRYCRSLMTIELNYYNLFLLYHNDPHIEMFGYTLLNALGLCPQLIFHSSTFDLKTYVMMEEISAQYKFYEIEEFVGALNGFSVDQLRESTRLFHQLKIIHSLFLFNDFHNQNIALNVDIENGVQSLQFIDFWPCQTFFPVVGLFHPIFDQDDSIFMGVCYNKFYKTFIKLVPNISDQYYLMTYDSFLQIIISIYDTVIKNNGDRNYLFEPDAPLTVSLFTNFYSIQMQNFEERNLVNMESDDFTRESYSNHFSTNMKIMISHFASGTYEQLKTILSDLIFIRFYLGEYKTIQRKELHFADMLKFEVTEKFIFFLDENQINSLNIITELKENMENVLLLLSYTDFSQHILSFDIIIEYFCKHNYDYEIKLLKKLPQ